MTPRRKSGKQQLQHWLWRMVDSGTCPGVQWLDRAQRSFKVPWVNQKSSEWSEAYAQLFAEYAKHRGKLQTGGKIDHPKCKHNFKSAVGKNEAVKCLCKNKTKKYRVYRFEADYSSRNDREDGNYQQTRSQSSDGGVDVWMEGIGVGTQELDDAGTSQVSTEQICLVQLNSGRESSPADFHQDFSGGLLEDADGMGESGFCHEPLQGGSKLVDLDSLDEMVATLALSTFADNSVGEGSYIQITTVDSTTGIRSGYVESTGDGQSLTATSQAQSDDVHESSAEINTQLTNSNMSMAGCTTIVQTDKSSTQLLLSQLGILGHEANLCNKPGFLNSSMDVTNNHQFAVSLNNSSLQSLTNSSSSMDTSEEENNQKQVEAALPTSVSSSTDPETACPQPGTVASACAQEPNLMVIQIIYSSPQRVMKKEFITSNKCKIFFGRVNNRRIQEAIDKKDEGAVRIELPAVDESNFEDPSKTRIEKTLERMEQGVVISYRDNDIYVTRRCQSKVFLTDGVSTNDDIPRSRMKEPDQEVKAFDFAMFEKSVNSHKTKTGCIGKDHFILTLGGEILKNDQNPSRVVPIRIDVQHFKAADMRYQALGGKDAFIPDPQYSLSDSFDNQVHLSNATF